MERMKTFDIALDGCPEPKAGTVDPARWAAGMLSAALLRAGCKPVSEAKAQVVIRAGIGASPVAASWAQSGAALGCHPPHLILRIRHWRV